MISKKNELMHYGVLGMKWGRRKGRSYSENRNIGKKVINYAKKRQEQRHLQKAQRKWDKKFEANKEKITSQANKKFYDIDVPNLNKKYAKYNFEEKMMRYGELDKKTSIAFEKYLNEYSDLESKRFKSEQVKVLGKRPR